MYGDFHLTIIHNSKKFGSHLNVQKERINTLQNMCWHIYSYNKKHTLKEYLRAVKRLTGLRGRKRCKQAHSLEKKNGGNTSKY